MDRYRAANLELWDELTEIHVSSPYYDVERFKASHEPRLDAFEIEELGDVSGKTLLHLQCHFGLDTLSWARLGATVTGVDFSPKAISAATELAREVGIDARFILSELYALPEVLDERFDIVYTSNGVLGWLPDIDAWGGIVDRFLRPGGTFYITEFHPVMWAFDDSPGVTELRVKYDYFPKGTPDEFPVDGDYADPEAEVKTRTHFAWFFSLASVVTALTSRGLHIEFLHEFDHCASKVFPFMDVRDGRFFLPERIEGEIPLSFSIRATKP